MKWRRALAARRRSLYTTLFTSDFTGANGSAPPSGLTLALNEAGSSATIQSNALRVTTGTGTYGAGHRAYRLTSGPHRNTETLIKYTPTTGAEQYLTLIGRGSSDVNADGYHLAYDLAGDTLRLERWQSFVGTALATASFTMALGTAAFIRFRVVESRLQARMWLASGTEPTTWAINVTDTTLNTAGHTGFKVRAGSASAVADLDDYTVTNGGAAPQSSLVTRSWLSGASGGAAADGSWATWMGSGYALAIGGTWTDNQTSQINQWGIAPGFEWGSWTGPLDNAVGGIYKDNGDTWAAAASGAYDARWTTCIDKVKEYRLNKGTTYIRFAHEFNGNWYPWSVSASEAANFILAWRRFRNIQAARFPAAKLVWCPNHDSVTDLDVRNAWPGASYVDVYGLDQYNQWPATNTVAGFNSKINATQNGAPSGMETHRAAAASYGLPFALCEWASNGDTASAASGLDAPVYMEELHKWLTLNGGTGPGNVLYEVLFNVAGFGTGQFALWPSTLQPLARDKYKLLWGGV